jgi:hypothetical protein
LWERYANDGRLTLEEYRDKLGGVQRVVGEAADNVLKSARMTRDQERLLRAAFLAMMRITDDGKYARRTVKWNALPEPVRPLLERFVEARLLVSGTDGPERTVEVAHERLFESWEQLRDWISETPRPYTCGKRSRPRRTHGTGQSIKIASGAAHA